MVIKSPSIGSDLSARPEKVGWARVGLLFWRESACVRTCCLSSASQQTQLKLSCCCLAFSCFYCCARIVLLLPLCARARLCSSSSRVASSSFWQKKKSMFAFKVANCNLDKQKLELRLLALKCDQAKPRRSNWYFLLPRLDGTSTIHFVYLSVRDTSDYIYRLFCG